MTQQQHPLAKSSSREIDDFLSKARGLPAKNQPGQGRLIFALDATASRQATWDRACHLQAQMFRATAQVAALSLQLCYYRGFDEFKALPWSSDSSRVRNAMLSVQCRGGYSQIERLLRHALREHDRRPVKALVFVGDAMEENSASLFQLAGQLGLRKLPAFMFQEGFDRSAGSTFSEIARLSGGAHCQFDEHSEDQLRILLTAVALYTTGGPDAIKRLAKQDPRIQTLFKSMTED